MSIDVFLDLPPSRSCRVLDFDAFELLESAAPVLIVRGHVPCYNMAVTLAPMIYLETPEYWGIEVVGRLPEGICLTAIKPYAASLVLDSAIGTKGIEIVGATHSERIEIDGLLASAPMRQVAGVGRGRRRTDW